MTYHERSHRTIYGATSFLFVLYVVACYMLMLASARAAGSCSCPSCTQRDAVQRCACCVYRQYGKRSQSFSSTNQAHFPDYQPNFEHPTLANAPNLKDWFGSDSVYWNNLNQLFRGQTNSNQTPNDGQGNDEGLESDNRSNNFFTQKRNNHTIFDIYRKRADLVSMLVTLIEEKKLAASGLKKFQQMSRDSHSHSYHPLPEGMVVDLGQETSLGMSLMQLVQGSRRR